MYMYKTLKGILIYKMAYMYAAMLNQISDKHLCEIEMNFRLKKVEDQRAASMKLKENTSSSLGSTTQDMIY